MLIYAGSVFLIGIVLAAKFRVLILLPMTVVVLAGGVGLGVFQSYSMAGGMLLTAFALQIGYLVGSLEMFASQRDGQRNSRLDTSANVHRRRFG